MPRVDSRSDFYASPEGGSAQPLAEFVQASRAPGAEYNRTMSVYDEMREELEQYETMMGVPRGRLAVGLDLVTDAMALVGQHGVYCQSLRQPGRPVMDIQLVLKQLSDAKELIQSSMEQMKRIKGS